jgi:hypothetical protein
MDSHAGELLQRVADLDAALQGGFTVTLADVTAEEFIAWRVLVEERVKYQEEQHRAQVQAHRKAQGAI